MDIVEFISRYAHVLTAILLAGGAMFLRFVLLPAVDGTELKEPLHERVRPKWAKLVGIGILVMIVSGFYNYIVYSVPQHKGDGLYHILMAFKMLAAFTAFFLAAALSGRSPKLQPLRDNWRTTGGLLVALLMVIVAIASYLKVRGLPKPATPEVEARIAPANESPLVSAVSVWSTTADYVAKASRQSIDATRISSKAACISGAVMWSSRSA